MEKDNDNGKDVLANVIVWGVAALGYMAASGTQKVQEMERQIQTCAPYEGTEFRHCMERQFPLLLKKPFQIGNGLEPKKLGSSFSEPTHIQ